MRERGQALSGLYFAYGPDMDPEVLRARGGGRPEVAGVACLADHRLGNRTWAVGRYSIADIHLFRLFWRFRPFLADRADTFPHLSAHHDRMMQRPAVQQTIASEAALGYSLPA